MYIRVCLCVYFIGICKGAFIYMYLSIVQNRIYCAFLLINIFVINNLHKKARFYFAVRIDKSLLFCFKKNKGLTSGNLNSIILMTTKQE